MDAHNGNKRDTHAARATHGEGSRHDDKIATVRRRIGRSMNLWPRQDGNICTRATAATSWGREEGTKQAQARATMREETQVYEQKTREMRTRQ
jgi:hypothetical protein